MRTWPTVRHGRGADEPPGFCKTDVVPYEWWPRGCKWRRPMDAAIIASQGVPNGVVEGGHEREPGLGFGCQGSRARHAMVIRRCPEPVSDATPPATVCLDDKGSDRALTVATSSKSNKVDADDDGQNEASARWVRRLLPCEDGP